MLLVVALLESTLIMPSILKFYCFFFQVLFYAFYLDKKKFRYKLTRIDDISQIKRYQIIILSYGRKYKRSDAIQTSETILGRLILM